MVHLFGTLTNGLKNVLIGKYIEESLYSFGFPTFIKDYSSHSLNITQKEKRACLFSCYVISDQQDYQKTFSNVSILFQRYRQDASYN